ncbi:MAG: hypothetical protein HN665_00280 [Candidatus Marinimicrobia bacterium]|jgi:hypothetical protein|nr:hypothetical protein [Candidatus Neomarinimicrobiota bacterium]MBT7494857.1 hypothetical protein [Candidatus Neomarinimicrobiota bacterium]
MLAEKYFPRNSGRYGRLAAIAKKMDGFAALNPERWFGIWAMVLAGANVSAYLEDRWLYWEWSTFSYFLVSIMVIALVWDKFMFRFPLFPQKVDSIKSASFMLLTGFALFFLGTIPAGFDPLVFAYGLPYFIFFVVAHLTYAIPIKENEKGERSVPEKSEMTLPLAIIIGLTIITATAGVLHDDPIISTISAVYLPFPLVALIFPSAVRHLQRCRAYVVFIPVMFIAVRFPWFLFMVIPLFWILRHYNYFRHGVVSPSFKVDLPDGNDG